MGLIRKGLHIATVGGIAPNSKKQRVAKQQLAALQGKSEAEVRRAGGRYEHSIGAELARSREARARGEVTKVTQTPAWRSAHPLWRPAAEVRRAGAGTWQAGQYESWGHGEKWRRKWLAKHPDIAARLFPDGIPGEPGQRPAGAVRAERYLLILAAAAELVDGEGVTAPAGVAARLAISEDEAAEALYGLAQERDPVRKHLQRELLADVDHGLDRYWEVRAVLERRDAELYRQATGKAPPWEERTAQQARTEAPEERTAQQARTEAPEERTAQQARTEAPEERTAQQARTEAPEERTAQQARTEAPEERTARLRAQVWKLYDQGMRVERISATLGIPVDTVERYLGKP